MLFRGVKSGDFKVVLENFGVVGVFKSCVRILCISLWKRKGLDSRDSRDFKRSFFCFFNKIIYLFIDGLKNRIIGFFIGGCYLV